MDQKERAGAGVADIVVAFDDYRASVYLGADKSEAAEARVDAAAFDLCIGCSGGSFRCVKASMHTRTQKTIIEKFLPVVVDIGDKEEEEGVVVSVWPS